MPLVEFQTGSHLIVVEFVVVAVFVQRLSWADGLAEDLCKKMKRHSEVKWSEVVRKALADYVSKMEIVEGGTVPSEKLLSMLKDANLDTEEISFEKAVENYEKGRELEWKRLEGYLEGLRR